MAKRKAKWKVTTTRAGEVTYKVGYVPVNRWDRPRHRALKSKASTEAQKRLNFRHAFEKLTLLLAANFRRGTDYVCTLTFAPGTEPLTRKEVKAFWTKFVRQLRDSRRRRGLLLLWVCCIECKHGAGRWHIHAVINAADLNDLDEIAGLWSYGHVKITRLFEGKYKENTWQDLAAYMCKERPTEGKDTTPVGSRVYSCSRGLKQPETSTEWISADKVDELFQLPAAAHQLSTPDNFNESAQMPYFRYCRYMLPNYPAAADSQDTGRSPHQSRHKVSFPALAPRPCSDLTPAARRQHSPRI